jgi:hypothetical protein
MYICVTYRESFALTAPSRPWEGFALYNHLEYERGIPSMCFVLFCFCTTRLESKSVQTCYKCSFQSCILDNEITAALPLVRALATLFSPSFGFVFCLLFLFFVFCRMCLSYSVYRFHCNNTIVKILVLIRFAFLKFLQIWHFLYSYCIAQFILLSIFFSMLDWALFFSNLFVI